MDKNSLGRKAPKLGDKEKSKSLFPWISFNRLYNLKTEKKKSHFSNKAELFVRSNLVTIFY